MILPEDKRCRRVRSVRHASRKTWAAKDEHHNDLYLSTSYRRPKADSTPRLLLARHKGALSGLDSCRAARRQHGPGPPYDPSGDASDELGRKRAGDLYALGVSVRG